MQREGLTFVNIGDAASGAIVDERLVGVLYCAADEYDTAGAGEPEGAGIGFVLLADDPLNPQRLETSPQLPTFAADEVVANVDEAMDAAVSWFVS